MGIEPIEDNVVLYVVLYVLTETHAGEHFRQLMPLGKGLIYYKKTKSGRNERFVGR